MNSNDDPYEALGVNRNASKGEIKSAYRKLALKFHPDKQRGSEEDKAKAAAIFTKIGNAYEILSDDEARAKYDSGGFSSSTSDHYASNFGRRPSQHRSPFDDPFFTGGADPFSSFGQRRNSRQQQQQQHHHFTDPFDLFNRVFAEEFGARGSFNRRSVFDEDPFFADPFGRSGSASGFGGFGMMDQMMSSMMNNHRDMFNHHQNGGNARQFSSFSSSSNSGRRGSQQSVSTRTMIVNGQRKTITERTVVKPDGTVETHVEESCDDGFPSNQFLEDNRRPSRNMDLERRSSRNSRR